jgi:lipooligosaccharide transport system permease protein
MRVPRLGVAMRVWIRNALVFRYLWRGSLLPPFLDPVLYFLALGFGLGAYVGSIAGIPYRDFIAPGLCATAALWGASFEATFTFYWKMEYGRIHDNILATPVEAEDLVLGELLWAGTRAMLYATSFLAVIALLGYVHRPSALALPPFLFLGGLAYAAIGMAYAMYVPHTDYFAYFFTLIVNPMFLFGGVFFPVASLPGWAQTVAFALPTEHLVDIARAFSNGQVDALAIAGHAAWLLVLTVLFALVPLWRLRRRLVG